MITIITYLPADSLPFSPPRLPLFSSTPKKAVSTTRDNAINVNVCMGESKPTNYWIRKKRAERSVLEHSGEWLNDLHIMVANKDAVSRSEWSAGFLDFV